MMLARNSPPALHNGSLLSGKRPSSKGDGSVLLIFCLSHDGFVEGRLICDSTF